MLTTLATEFARVQPLVLVRFPGRRSATGRSRTTARRSATSAWRCSIRTRSSRASTSGSIGAKQDRQDLLLRHEELVARSGQPAAAPAAVLRDLPAVPRRTATSGMLPDYSFVEPNYSDHDGGRRRSHRLRPASRPPRAGRRAVHRGGLQRDPPERRALGIDRPADRVRRGTAGSPRSACRRPADVTPDGFVAQPDATGTGKPFLFDAARRPRAGGCSSHPWVPPGTVVRHRIASSSTRRIPATATTSFFLGPISTDRSPRSERPAETLSRPPDARNAMRTDRA